MIQKGELAKGVGWSRIQQAGLFEMEMDQERTEKEWEDHAGKAWKAFKELFSLLSELSASGKDQDTVCDQTPVCPFSLDKHAPEVMHTPSPQSQSHLLSTKPTLTSV